MGISHVFTAPIADGTNTQLVRPSDWNSSHAYTLQDAVSLSGNTAGVLANISSGTVYLAGGNNITLSQNGNSITLSGANAGGVQTGISGIIGSDATYTSGTVQFTGSNMVTVKSSAGQRIVIDATQTVQTQMTGLTAGMSTNGNTLGDTGLVSNRLVLIGGNNITLSGSVNGQSMSVTISGPNAGGAQTGISGIQVSDSTFTSGTVSFRNANGLSFGSSGANGVSASYTVPTVTNSSWTVSDAATSGSVARLAFTNLNGVTLSLSSGAGGSHTIVGSHNALTSQSTDFHAMTLGGNTAGTTTFHATNNRTLFFNGGNNITLSGNGSTVTISAAAQSAQTGISGIQVSDTTYTSGTVTFLNANGASFGSSGANGISLSYTQDTTPPIATTVQSVGSANSVGTVTRFAPEDHQHEGVYAMGVSNLGNTLGNTTVEPGRWVIAAMGNLSASVATGANNLNTLSLSDAGPMSRWWMPGALASHTVQQGNSSVSIVPILVQWPVAFSQVRIAAYVTVQTTTNNSSAYLDVTCSAVLYSRNVSTLSSILSGSVGLTASRSSNATGSATGAQLLIVTHPATTLSPGEYYWAFHVSTTNTATGGANTTALANTLSMIGIGGQSAVHGARVWNVGTNDTQGAPFGLGILSTGATRASLGFSAYTQTGASAAVAPLYVELNNATVF